MTSGTTEAAALVEALTDWVQQDLLSAYRVLCLALNWQTQTTWHAVWEGSELRAVAGRWDPVAGQQAPIHCYYAARDEAALGELLAAAPPARGGLVCGPDNPCHDLLRRVPGASAQSSQIFYRYESDAPAADPEVSHFSAQEAIAIQLAGQPDWPSIVGKNPAPRPIHAISRDGRVVAVAAAGCPTPLTEEVCAVWVEPASRRRGFARAVVSATTRDILSRGRLPIYTHDADNPGSQRTAESVGYVRKGELLQLLVGG